MHPGRLERCSEGPLWLDGCRCNPSERTAPSCRRSPQSRPSALGQLRSNAVGRVCAHLGHRAALDTISKADTAETHSFVRILRSAACLLAARRPRLTGPSGERNPSRWQSRVPADHVARTRRQRQIGPSRPPAARDRRPSHRARWQPGSRPMLCGANAKPPPICRPSHVRPRFQSGS